MKLTIHLLLTGLSSVLARPPTEYEIRPSILEARVDRLLFDVSMEQFQKERNKKPIPDILLDWRSNGCTGALDEPFDYNFLPSCQRHDFGYLNYRKQGRYPTGKDKLDENFKKDMLKECSRYSGVVLHHCNSVADIYHWAVQQFGDDYDMYRLPQDLPPVLEGMTIAVVDNRKGDAE